MDLSGNSASKLKEIYTSGILKEIYIYMESIYIYISKFLNVCVCVYI